MFGSFASLAVVGFAVALAGCGGGGSTASPVSTAIPFTSGTVYVADPTKHQVLLFNPSPGPNSVPANPIAGSATGLTTPVAMAFDTSHNLYIAQSNNILVFQVGAQNNQAPLININGTNTQIGTLSGIAVDSSSPTNIFVSNVTSGGQPQILVFNINQNGNVAPSRVLTSSAMTNPRGLAVDAQQNLYVANGSANGGTPGILEFTQAQTNAAGAQTPANTLPGGTGSTSLLQNPADMIFTASGFMIVADSGTGSGTGAIYYYSGLSGGLNGPTAPSCVIQGTATTLNQPTGIALSAATIGGGTLYVANTTNMLLFSACNNAPPGSAGTNMAPEATLGTANQLGSVSWVQLSI